MILFSYDLDSLVYMADDIVEGEMGDTVIRDGFAVSDVAVSKVYKGGHAEGMHLQVSGLNLFAKMASGETSTPGRTERLAVKDHVFLFLVRRQTDKSSGDGDRKELQELVPSGVKLVVGDKVSGFSQQDNPGPYVEERGVASGNKTALSLNTYRPHLIEMVRKMEALGNEIQTAVKQGDVRFMSALLKSRHHEVRNGYGIRDEIAETVACALANTHDIDALDVSLEHDPWGILARGFGCPAGRDFLLKKIESDGPSLERKLRYARVIHAADFIYRSRITEIDSSSWRPTREVGPGNDGYVSRIAALAVKCRDKESLCAALVDCVGEAPKMMSDSERQACEKDFQSAFEILRGFYQSGVSENLRFAIEVAATNLGSEDYARLDSKCGPVISILRLPSDIGMYGRGPLPRLMLESDVLQTVEGRFIPSLVIENVETGERSVVKWKRETFGPQPCISRGSVAVEMPTDAKPGKYRVYCRFEQAGKVVSEGHFFETVWPHGDGYQDGGGKQ